MIEYRENGTVGTVSLNDNNTHLHFSEWWNGEGIDFEFLDRNYKQDRRISLHMEEIESIAIAALLCGMLDLNFLEADLKQAKEENEKYRAMLKQIRDKFNEDYYSS